MKRTRLNSVSKDPVRRKARLVPLPVIKEIQERSGGICEFVDGYGIRCTNEAMKQPHHKLKRSQGGKHTIKNCAASCSWHNHYAEIQPKICIKLGWVIPYEGYKHE